MIVGRFELGILLTPAWYPYQRATHSQGNDLLITSFNLIPTSVAALLLLVRKPCSGDTYGGERPQIFILTNHNQT
jgi:hypothetical protein